MTTNNPSLSRPIVAGAHAPRPSLLWRFLIALLRWQDHARQRQHLSALDPRMLRDMGMTPDDVSRQLGKIHWRH